MQVGGYARLGLASDLRAGRAMSASGCIDMHVCDVLAMLPPAADEVRVVAWSEQRLSRLCDAPQGEPRRASPRSEV